jgi:Nif-specific regulatory protein
MHKSETKKQIRGFSDDALEEMLSYSWPGNVRELENSVERAVVFSRDEIIGADALSLNTGNALAEESYAHKTLKEALNIFKKRFITKALETSGWHQTRTARALHIQRSYLSKLIRELNISRERGV